MSCFGATAVLCFFTTTTWAWVIWTDFNSYQWFNSWESFLLSNIFVFSRGCNILEWLVACWHLSFYCRRCCCLCWLLRSRLGGLGLDVGVGKGKVRKAHLLGGV